VRWILALLEKITSVFKDKKKIMGVVLLVSLGIMLLAFSSSGGEEHSAVASEMTLEEYKRRTEEELSELDRSLAELVYALGGREAFDRTLTLYHMTPYLYYTQTQTEMLYEKLNTYYLESGMILTSNEDVRALLDTDEYVRAKHILITNDAGDDHEANLATAKDILARLQNGEDFDLLMKEYSEDVNAEGAPNGPDGYYFFRGEMDESFENASFALKEGEFSDIVTSAYGYHIILRLEKEAEYMDTNLSSIKTAYAQLRFYQLLDEVVADWETLPCESYADYADPVFTGTSGKAAS
jgi:parvulin-like peptidyl-prolyl isomerase